MNKICRTPIYYRLGPALLLISFLVAGCGGFPAETRYDHSKNTYSTSGDEKAKIYATGQQKNSAAPQKNGYAINEYDKATAYYTLRQGEAQPGSRHTKTTVYHPAASQPEEVATAAVPEKEVAAGMPMVLEITDVLFEFDKWVLKSSVLPELDQWAEFFQKNPQVHAEIQGHADNTGSSAYNLELSRKRAQAVVDYLVGKGVDRSRLTAKGYGESKPIAPNTTVEGRQKNRRVEMHY